MTSPARSSILADPPTGSQDVSASVRQKSPCFEHGQRCQQNGDCGWEHIQASPPVCSHTASQRAGIMQCARDMAKVKTSSLISAEVMRHSHIPHFPCMVVTATDLASAARLAPPVLLFVCRLLLPLPLALAPCIEAAAIVPLLPFRRHSKWAEPGPPLAPELLLELPHDPLELLVQVARSGNTKSGFAGGQRVQGALRSW